MSLDKNSIKTRPVRVFKDSIGSSFYILSNRKKRIIKFPPSVKTLKDAQRYVLDKTIVKIPKFKKPKQLIKIKYEAKTLKGESTDDVLKKIEEEHILKKKFEDYENNITKSTVESKEDNILDSDIFSEIEQTGQGQVEPKRNETLPSLYSDEIDDYFRDQPNYSGTIASDQILDLPKTIPQGFVMNLDKSNQPGSHWVGVYICEDSVEYFDPLGNPIPPTIQKDLLSFTRSLDLPYMMKLKVNEIKQQHGNSHRCGYHSIRFVDDRLHDIPFPLTSRYKEDLNQTKKGEGIIKSEFKFI